MTQENPPQLPHILIVGKAKTEPYLSPSMGRGKLQIPQRVRHIHGLNLLNRLEQVMQEAEAIGKDQKAFGIGVSNGIYVQFESEPNFDLKYESLESVTSGIELLAVKEIDDKTLATCFVPEGQLSYFINKITNYLEKDTITGKPRNKPLVDSISDIRKTVLEALWTDEIEALPTDDEEIWWEVWLRVGDERDAFLSFFREHGTQIGLKIGHQEIDFLDRSVVVAQGNKYQMSKSVNLLNCIAELRIAKETADFFTGLTSSEQFEWINDALERIDFPTNACPAISILDTGVNNQHPLLKLALDNEDMHTYDPNWNVADHNGHGTLMAGLGLYGDLTELLTENGQIQLKHQLESVKILPPHGDNPPQLYGAITAEAIARAETNAPQRQRVICMAVSSTDSRDRGRPSSWSAHIDALAAGEDDDQRRLIIVSAGNTSSDTRHLYPDSNQTDGIHDPGQSWNAITVGAFTEKNSIDDVGYPGWNCLAPCGDLAPSSCTSLIWEKKRWPIKPDIVMEGGNMAINPGTGSPDYLDSLSLLSTYYRFTVKPLSPMRDTSAATALASRMAAMLQAEYPDYWPETIRGLLVHSAKWTDAMRARFAPLKKKVEKRNLLRYCGFGVPDLDEAMWSAQNSLTLIAQDSLQPFDKVKNVGKLRDLNIHSIPWPVEVLQELGETPVKMKITLSYFIELNPGERGWTRKYSYASHGLRFDVKTPTETPDQFRSRINKLARDEETGTTSTSDAESWFFGPNLRKRGSLHSDIWFGTAADLAERGYIAVYPVIGWWRERLKFERWNKIARYSLIVSIKTPETEVDLYTPVVNMIKTEILVEV